MADRKREQPMLERLQEETRGLAETIDELNRTQAKLHDETRVMKVETNQMKERIGDLKVSIGNVQQEIKRNKTHLVQSPQRCVLPVCLFFPQFLTEFLF